MQNLIWIILGVVVGGVVAYLILGRKKEEKKYYTGLSLLLQQMDILTKTVDQKLGESHKQVNESLRFHSTESNKIIREITEELVKVGEGQKQVVGFADQ